MILQRISHVLIGLKTVKGSKQLKLDPSIYDTLLKQKIEVGDVIYIEANSGAVKVRIQFYYTYFVFYYFLSLFFVVKCINLYYGV